MTVKENKDNIQNIVLTTLEMLKKYFKCELETNETTNKCTIYLKRAKSLLFYNIKSVTVQNPVEDYEVRLGNDITDMFNPARVFEIEGPASPINAEGTTFNEHKSKLKLEEIDLSSIMNTDNVINATRMFANLSSLKRVSFGDMSLSNLQVMNEMFLDCINIETVDFGNIRADGLIEINRCFMNCKNLRRIKASKLNPHNKCSCHMMFANCINLSEIYLEKFQTHETEKHECNRLSNTNTINPAPPTKSDSISNLCEQLSFVGDEYDDIFKTPSTEHSTLTYRSIFSNCNSLEKIICADKNIVETFNTRVQEIKTDRIKNEHKQSLPDISKETDIEPEKVKRLLGISTAMVRHKGLSTDEKVFIDLFKYAVDEDAMTVTITGFREKSTSNGIGRVEEVIVPGYVSFEGYMHHYYKRGKYQVYLPNNCNCLFANEKVFDNPFGPNDKDISETDNRALDMKKIDFTRLVDTTNVTNMSYMFANCYNLQEVKFSEYFNFKNVKSMSHMFMNCEALTAIDTDEIHAPLVEKMDYMFLNCFSLENVSFKRLKPKNLKSISNMFSNCINLQSINIQWLRLQQPKRKDSQPTEPSTKLNHNRALKDCNNIGIHNIICNDDELKSELLKSITTQQEVNIDNISESQEESKHYNVIKLMLDDA